MGRALPVLQQASTPRPAVDPSRDGSQAFPTSDGIEVRISKKQERVHVLTGAVCNNNCIFCMEEDRDARYVTNSATTDEVVRWILRENQGCEEICFTSGEPTTNPRLPQWARWAREHNVRRISVMTNGRALAYEKYARALASAGMNRFYVSIHGHTQKLHEALTRTPESFVQSLAGIDQIAKLKRYGIELHTSTVLTRRNLPHLLDIYRFLRSHGVDQVVFNVMQANGRANTFFDQLFPRYVEIADAMRAFLAEQSRIETQVMAFLVDIPLCTTEGIPDFNRGYVESYVHYEPSELQSALLSEQTIEERSTGPENNLVPIRRSDLDDAERHKRAECSSCARTSVCEGVWGNYLRRYGWDEFSPVP